MATDDADSGSESDAEASVEEVVDGVDAAVASTAGVDDDGAPDIAEEAVEQAPKSSLLTKTLLIVATILAIVTVFSVWGKTQLLDTDEWVELSTGLLEEPEVQETLATYLVETAYDEGDVAASLEETLPEDLSGLAGPIAGALRGPLTDGVQLLLSSDAFQAIWEEANRRAHETLVAILRDDTREGISTADGVVALELRPLVVSVGESIGISEERLDSIPDDAGRIVIFESEELDNAQQLVQVLDFLTWFLLIVVVLLYAAAVYVDQGRRLKTLRLVGWSLMGVGFIVLIVRAITLGPLINAIVEDPASRTTADVAAAVATELLREMGWSILIYGVLIVLFTSLMGDHRWAGATRRAFAPALNASTGAVVAGVIFLILLLAWWSPGKSFQGWTTSLILIALIIGAVVTLRRKTQEEFPDTTFDDVRGSLTSRAG
ncbi:MAG: hypothetical protein ACR2PK_09660 [Acidimicrobiales bacterium]